MTKNEAAFPKILNIYYRILREKTHPDEKVNVEEIRECLEQYAGKTITGNKEELCKFTAKVVTQYIRASNQS